MIVEIKTLPLDIFIGENKCSSPRHEARVYWLVWATLIYIQSQFFGWICYFSFADFFLDLILLESFKSTREWLATPSPCKSRQWQSSHFRARELVTAAQTLIATLTWRGGGGCGMLKHKGGRGCVCQSSFKRPSGCWNFGLTPIFQKLNFKEAFDREDIGWDLGDWTRLWLLESASGHANIAIMKNIHFGLLSTPAMCLILMKNILRYLIVSYFV